MFFIKEANSYVFLLFKNKVILPPLQKLCCTRLSSLKFSDPGPLGYTKIRPKK